MTDVNPLAAMQNAQLNDAINRNTVPRYGTPPDMQQLSNDVALQQKPAGPLASDSPPPGLIKQPLRNPLLPDAAVAAPVNTPPVEETQVDTQTPPVVDDDFVPALPEDLKAQPVDETDALLNLPDDDKVIASAATSRNFKLLKDNLKSTKEQLATRETEYKTTKEKLEAYEKGELVPEVFSQKEARIQELEQYEQIHNLQNTPGYKKEISEPLDTLINKISTFAEEHDGCDDIINKALDIEEEADLNKYISSKFDNVSAIELKSLITGVHELQIKARLAEAQPAKTLEALNEKYAATVQQETAQRRSKIAQVAKAAWVPVIEKLRTEGSAMSLLIKQGNPKYIEEHVTPMLQKAAQDYGRIAKILAENGLQQMPAEVAETLVRVFVLAHDGALSKLVGDAALKELELSAEARQRYNPLLRPPIGSRGSGMPAPVAQPEKPKTAREVGRELIHSTLRK